MRFEQAVEKVEDYSPVWRIDFMMHDIRVKTIFNRFLFEEAFKLGFWDVEFLVSAARLLKSIIAPDEVQHTRLHAVV